MCFELSEFSGIVVGINDLILMSSFCICRLMIVLLVIGLWQSHGGWSGSAFFGCGGTCFGASISCLPIWIYQEHTHCEYSITKYHDFLASLSKYSI